MKKSFLALLLVTTLTLPVIAQYYGQKEEKKPEPCMYTAMQNLVRDARSYEKIFGLMKDGAQMEDTTITCGGSLLQLAVRRGNPGIVSGILFQKPERANAAVSLKGFEIPDAPDEIPAVLFAAYYAPSELVFKAFTDEKADITLRDSKGHDILWYMDRNPVLRQSETEDNLRAMLNQQLMNQFRQQAPKEDEQVIHQMRFKMPENMPKQISNPTVDDSTLAEPNP